MASTLYMVDFSKIQGNYQDFYQLYKEIYASCEDLVSDVERRFAKVAN